MYNSDLVAAILQSWDQISSFIERTTQEIFPTYYEYKTNSDFWDEEGHTLLDKGPHNTRVPKRDQLKENLIVMQADISKAISQLSPGDQIELRYHYQISQAQEKPYSAQLIITKIVNILNNVLDDQQILQNQVQ